MSHHHIALDGRVAQRDFTEPHMPHRRPQAVFPVVVNIGDKARRILREGIGRGVGARSSLVVTTARPEEVSQLRRYGTGQLVTGESQLLQVRQRTQGRRYGTGQLVVDKGKGGQVHQSTQLGRYGTG